MPSYQDVDWGYNNDAPLTGDPVRLADLNAHLARAGYQMMPRNPLDPESQYFVHYEHPLGAGKITLAAPQWRAEGYLDELVYDLTDIRDMLSHVHGGTFDGHELKANRRSGC